MPGCHVQPEQMFNLIFGYSDAFAETIEVVGTGGNDVAGGSIVPSGEVWVATGISAQHNDPTARHTMLGVNDGTDSHSLLRQQDLAQWFMLAEAVHWVLKAGWTVYAQFNSLGIGREGSLRVLYYKMILVQ